MWAPLVTAASWSSIILQMSFPMMLLNRATRVIALFGILGFHIGIAIMMGLPWFSLVMIAIDSIFIRDVTWRRVIDFTRSSWTTALDARVVTEPPPRVVPVVARVVDPTTDPAEEEACASAQRSPEHV